jgi:hypothetical protein
MPPEFVISIKLKNEEYMVGVTCNGHKNTFVEKLIHLQKIGKVPDGVIKLTELKAIGTDCIRMDPDDLIRF